MVTSKKIKIKKSRATGTISSFSNWQMWLLFK